MPSRSLRTAASGMAAQQLNIQIIANNIANINTTGFKKSKAEFQDLMYQTVSVNSSSSTTFGRQDASSTKIQVGNGVQPASTQKIFMQGDLVATNNEFDVAIQGEGFFQVRKPDGSFGYTRDGSFKINAEGQMVTSNGYILEPEITLNDDAVGIIVGRDGTLQVREADGETYILDNLQLARFMNPAGLDPVGDNLFRETEISGTALLGTPGASGFGELHQGYLESSNVEIVEEMIAMIAAQRAYEINSKTVKTVEDMMQQANNLKRG
ncbi:MAG: flagellar basal-body rod protein FlgG [Melioribacteraceae bacterium]|nr:MAG: flagellar basal-body rod protein FlgG [Melioribacteraceae bacterium]